MPDGGLDLARSRAVLIGTGNYGHLPPVPAARHSLARMRSLLTGDLCGWPADSVSVFADERDPGRLPHALVELFLAARDVALFYFVGHGQVDPDDSLCLALVDSRTEAELRRTTSLAFDSVRYALRLSRAGVKIVILDCCYAGLAARPTLSAGDLSDLTRGTGAYTLAAAGEFSRAWFETDHALTAPQTYFTKYLADVVERGIPGRGPELTIEPIFHETAEALARDGKPVPTSRASGHAGRLVFARNAAPMDAPNTGAAEEPPPKPAHPQPRTTSVSTLRAVRDPGLTRDIITVRVWAHVVVKRFEEGMEVTTASGLVIPRMDAISSSDPEFAYARDLAHDLASELRCLDDDLSDKLDSLAAAAGAPVPRSDPGAFSDAALLRALRRAVDAADKLMSGVGRDLDTQSVEDLISLGKLIIHHLEEIPLDASDADLTTVGLTDAEVSWLAGIVWNHETAWPPKMATKIKAGSHVIGPNTFQIAPARPNRP
jgi:hypothetical protein